MNRIGDWFITLLYVAMIYVLVQPNSQGPQFVEAIATGVGSMIGAATGNGSSSTTQSQGGTS